MIHFTREGTLVRCAVTVDVPTYGRRSFHFEWEANSDIFAGLLSAHLSETYNKNEDEIRREAYERGWKAAKARKAKDNW